MSCNVDLLHIGIWTFYSGASLMLASVISYNQLGPIEKDDLLKERNDIRQKVMAKQTLTPVLPVVVGKRLNFSV
jgi:hypothetical protein